ncbi:MAG TPA: metal-dependent hydrolase [Candidatus Acidoferrales bacterium]|nr:metal-dependent hydrolase [Candidatus Acidoferrales bacterium]
MGTWNKGFRLTWLGHSAFELVSSAGRIVLIDPWLEGNPRCPADRKRPARADAIAVTHAHGDHASEVVALATRLGCPVIASFEVAEHFSGQGVKTCVSMGKGGTVHVAGLAFTMVPASHSSSFDEPGRPNGGGEAGIVVTLEDGTRVYHAGDTGPTMEMVMVRELYAPEIAILPIGDLYTMGPREAAWAAEKLGARWIVPMHYGTFPALTGTPAALRQELERRGVAAEVIAPEPGVGVA